MHHQNVDFLLKTIDDNNARILPNRAKALAMIGSQIDMFAISATWSKFTASPGGRR